MIMVLKNELKLALIKHHKNINRSLLIWIVLILAQILINNLM